MATFKSLKTLTSIPRERPAVTIDHTQRKITINYVFQGFHHFVGLPHKIDDQEVRFDHVTIKDAGFLMDPGLPMLPSFGRYVQIPGDCGYRVEKVETKGGSVTFDNINVVPAQMHSTDAIDKDKKFDYDKKCYSRDEFYPKDIVHVSGPYNIDNYRALLVHVTPLRFNPKQNQLKCHESVSVTLEITQDVETDGDRDIPGRREGFGNLLLNPGRRIEEKLGLSPGKVSIGGAGPELLIIHADGFAGAAQKLAEWKESRGIETRVVSIEDIGNDVGSLKAFIRRMKKDSLSRLGYVLLLGDVEAIKPEIIRGRTATDYYYSTQYDETTPDPLNTGLRLFMPWLAIGRIPVQPDLASNNIGANAMAVVDKIIAYEKRLPDDDPDYYKRMTFVAAFDDTDSPADQRDNCTYLETVEYICSAMESQGYKGERIYLTNNTGDQLYYMDGTLIPDDIRRKMIYRDSEGTARQKLIDAIKKGQLIVCHRGHGDPGGWVHPRFDTVALTEASSDKYSIFYSMSCWTGMFDAAPTQACFAEKSLRMQGGAPSLIASTRASYTVLNDDLLKALFDATFAGVLPTYPDTTANLQIRKTRLGDILNYAKSYLLVSVNAKKLGVEYVKEQLELYHVIGDPTLELWTEPPRELDVQAGIIGSVLDIKLTSCPSGCVVTIWSEGKVFKRLEPCSTHMTIPYVGGHARISCWAPGYTYAEAVIS